METAASVIGIATAVVQLAGVFKRHVTAFSTLGTLALSIESKTGQVCSIANQFRNLTQISVISAEVLENTLRDLHEVRLDLTNTKNKMEDWKRTGMLILQAPVFLRELRDSETKLSQLDFYLRTVYALGSMISAQRNEMNDLLISTLLQFVNTDRRGDIGRQILLDLECGILARESSAINLDADAEHAFIMGLASYDSKPEKGKIITTPSYKVRSAARYFHKACELGKKEAFRYLGDIYCDGIGATRCYRKAIKLYEQGAARNDAGAKYALAWCYEFGHGVDVVPAKSKEYYEQAMAGGSGEAMSIVGLFKLHGKMFSSNHSEAFRLLWKANSMNVFSAKLPLALCYNRGIGADYNPVKAFELFKESFYGGALLTTFQLANCYDTGSGVERNPREAATVYEHCVNAGTWHGNRYKPYYGLRLIHGLGVEKNEPLGLALILDAAKNGISWYVLGECYHHGIGVKKNLNRAKEFYRNAIGSKGGTSGIVSAYMALGEMFEMGEGVNVDIRRANKYYLSAADRLNPSAQWRVAMAFESGVGLQKDLHRAVFYYEMCANSGHRDAQLKYVSYYMKGHGIERCRFHATKLIEEAARDGNREAKQWLKREKRGLRGILHRDKSV